METDRKEAMDHTETAIPVVPRTRTPTKQIRTTSRTRVRLQTRTSNRAKVRTRIQASIHTRVRERTRIETVSDAVTLRIGLVSARWRERTHEPQALIRVDLHLHNHSEMFDL